MTNKNNNPFLDLPLSIQEEIRRISNLKEEVVEEEIVEEEYIIEEEDFFAGLEDIDEDYEVDLSEYEGVVDKGEYLGDIIGKDYIRSLKNNKIELITSDTGTGKSTFAKEVIGEVAKERERKVLILSHRKVLRDASTIDTQGRNKEGLVIDKTYHSIMNDKTDLSSYEFIICDEVHFLLKDSCFINFTDDILYKLLKASRMYNTKLIMLTATPKGLKEAIQEKVDIEINHLDLTTRDFVNINEVKLGYNMASMEYFIDEELRKGHKGVVYINNKETLLELYTMDKYRDRSMFICSDYSGRHYTKYLDREKIDFLNRKQRFPEGVDIIFTTGILSDGINIKDKEYRFLAMKEFSEAPIIQTIGRKRFNRGNYKLEEWEKLNLFFLNYNGNQFHKDYVERLNRRLNVKKDYEKLIYKDFFLKYRKTTSLDNKSVYLGNDGRLTYNEFNTKQAEILLQEIELIQRFSFEQYIKTMLGGVEIMKITGIERLKDDEQLLELLEELKNKKLYTLEDKEELIETMNVRKNGRRLRSRKVLSSALEEADLPYRIEKCKREDKFINGKRHYFNGIWRVVDIRDDREVTEEQKQFARENNIYLSEELVYRQEDIRQSIKALYDNNMVLLEKEQKDIFINYINATFNGNQIRSIGKLNKVFELFDSDYRLESYETTRTIKGERKRYSSAWRVNKVK